LRCLYGIACDRDSGSKRLHCARQRSLLEPEREHPAQSAGRAPMHSSSSGPASCARHCPRGL
jgi:hypothetical protein